MNTRSYVIPLKELWTAYKDCAPGINSTYEWVINDPNPESTAQHKHTYLIEAKYIHLTMKTRVVLSTTISVGQVACASLTADSPLTEDDHTNIIVHLMHDLTLLAPIITK